MRITINGVATLLIVCLAVITLNLGVLRPWTCNLAEGEVDGLTLRIYDRGAYRVAMVPIARQNIRRLAPCITCTTDASLLMLLAANLRFIGRNNQAVLIYREAMRIDRRPELYLNLGQALVETGHDAEGLQFLIKACLYNPEYEDDIAAHHEEVRQAVDHYYRRIVAHARTASQ